MTEINGASVLVTGGNRGLGRAIVNELLARGAAKVYSASRTLQTTDDPRIVPVELDVTDLESIRRAVNSAADVSIVVNNAGLVSGTRILDENIDGIRVDLETNLFGTLNVARAFAPVLAQHQRSALLNVHSVLSWFATGSGYEISKAAVWSATNGLRVLLADQGTIVTGLHVGYMDTDMIRDLDVPKTDPALIARQAVDAIERGDYEVLADDVSREVKGNLSAPITAMYPQLVTN
jgi:NAD(P)-dependent dehydrogenase (short-subunit alcohol dehydrogenase family)